MTIACEVTQLIFSDGSTIAVPPKGVVAIVGPNNTGKTATLHGIAKGLSARPTGPVLDDIGVSVRGGVDDFYSWFSANYCSNETAAHKFNRESLVRGKKSVSTGSISRDRLKCFLTTPGERLGEFAEHFTTYLGAEERLSVATSCDAHDPRRENPTTPLQNLVHLPQLEEELREECRRTFGHPFFIQREPGKKIYTIWGDQPVGNTGQRHDTPTMDDQGHGVRSYIGTLLSLRHAIEPIVLLDEPEAFLHPPQARRIGTLIRAEATKRQIFVATHSVDVLRGLMDGDSATPLTIVRLQRTRTSTIAAAISPSNLDSVWSNGLARYTGIIDGIFHDRTILCESDADCMYYEAAWDYFWSKKHGDARQPDVMFAQTGGKDGFPRAAEILKTLRVPYSIIADIDILNSRQTVNRLGGIMGIGEGDIDRNYRIVEGAIQNIGVPPPATDQVRQEVMKILDSTGRSLTNEASKQLAKAVSIGGKWDLIKRVGTTALKGEERRALDALLERLARANLLLVPVGELENWVPDASNKSSKWIADVLQRPPGPSVFPNALESFIYAAAQGVSLPIESPLAQPTRGVRGITGWMTRVIRDAPQRFMNASFSSKAYAVFPYAILAWLIFSYPNGCTINIINK